MGKLKGLSLNTRGLKNEFKRCSVFNWLLKQKQDFYFLQETHSEVDNETKWKIQWGHNIIYSHGTNNSAGVAIMLSSQQDIEIEHIEKDKMGRVLLAKIKYNGTDDYVLVNIYAPTKKNIAIQLQFVETLLAILEPYQGENIIIGGDWNTIMTDSLDKRGGLREPPTKYQIHLHKFIESFQLSDVWREHHPSEHIYTWRQNTPYVETRLDFWLVSQFITPISNTNILPDKVKTDHKAITITITFPNHTPRGPGYWKFNNQLLVDSEYTYQIKQLLIQLKGQYDNTEDAGLIWDIIKCRIRGYTIEFSKYKSRAKQQNEKLLQKQQTKLSENLNIFPNNTYIQDKLLTVQNEL